VSPSLQRPLLTPGQKLGSYVIECWLGAGAMAEVWQAKKPGAAGWVVIKRLHDYLAADARQVDRFVDEAELAHRLNHPNLVRVREVTNDGGVWFLVMEWVDGIELRTVLDLENGPLKPALAAHYAAQAAVGLAYAQGRKDSKGRSLNFVHRDIAPDNIMVDVAGQVRVVDFGLARMMDTEVTTQTGLRKGKLRYMAREYLRDHVFDASTDVYALGATLFEMATGARPFHEVSGPLQIMDLILREELPRASELRPSLPTELVDIIFDATRADPALRIGTAAELATRLLSFGAHTPPPPAKELGAAVKKWQQLHRAQPVHPRKPVGAFGQLETTEAVPTAPPNLGLKRKKKAGTGLGESVAVAHQTDHTEAVTAPNLKSLGDDGAAPTEQLSVIVDLDATAPRPIPKSKRKPR
jgi:serine/threonine-protein kinase